MVGVAVVVAVVVGVGVAVAVAVGVAVVVAVAIVMEVLEMEMERVRAIYSEQAVRHGISLVEITCSLLRMDDLIPVDRQGYVSLWRALYRAQLADWGIDFETASAVARNVMQALIGDDDAVTAEIADAATQPIWVAGDGIWYCLGAAVYAGMVEAPGSCPGTYAVWLPREYWIMRGRYNGYSVAPAIAERSLRPR